LEVPAFNKDQKWFTLHNFFVALDAMLKLYDRVPLMWLREKALHRATTWMLEHMKGSGGRGRFIRPWQIQSSPFAASPIRSMIHWFRRRSTKSNRWKCTTPYRSVISARDTASSALPLADLGHGVAHERLDRDRDAGGHHRFKRRAYMVSRQRKRWEIGNSRLPMRSREGGTSSLRMNSIPTSMTRRWC